MNNSFLINSTKLSFISLAFLPILKESYNSILIFICAFFVILNLIKSKSAKPFSKDLLFLSILFWMFLLHEIISTDLNFNRILRYLPILIFPLIFFYRPKYINEKIKKISIKTFQISSLVQCSIYLFIFLEKYSLSQVFYISPESVPIFREYVFSNYFYEIHPTYFSSYLLVSATISLFYLSLNNNNKLFNFINLLVSIFFIFIFSSKIILIILILTIVIFIIYMFFRKRKSFSLKSIVISTALILILFYPSSQIIVNRFNEVKNEINKPIVGDYYNSTNTRVAIFKCSLILLKEVPIFGFGDDLQQKLDDCYANTNDSEFYKISTFNTHNYYVNLILYGGWVFLLLFLLYLIVVFKKIKYSILGLFLLMQFLIINLTENYFSRHFGVVLFAYFMSLFIFINDKVEEPST